LLTHQTTKLIGDRPSGGIFTEYEAGNGDYNE
jgi:hypothetical protein